MPEPAEAPQYLSYAEAAEIVGVSKGQIKLWAQQRAFPVLDLSHKVKRIRRDDLDAFMASRVSPAR